MTHTEDVRRASSPAQVDFLNLRIEALEKRIEFLEAIIEVNNLIKEEE
ncbi:hypothetical protein [uncultured Polaribacter sp.]|nr:hypothetical protein [uncultured Polaribacter sp.]